MGTEQVQSPCGTCPWLKRNQGKHHADSWYSRKNLTRLWNGMKQGEAMICHSTDPGSIHYGGDLEVAEGHERICIGILGLVQREINLVEAAPSLQEYRRSRQGQRPMTRTGLMRWVERIAFGNLPTFTIPDDLGTPWDNDDAAGDQAGSARAHLEGPVV